MEELESGQPADLEIEAPPGLMPDLAEWGIVEVERGVCEDTVDNRRVIRQNKGRFNTVFDTKGMPTGYLQVITADMFAMAQAMSKADLLTEPEDANSDYLSGIELIFAENASELTPTWVLNATRTYIRQQDEKRQLGGDAELHQSRLIAVPTRCKVIKADSTRCWGWADGSTESVGMCRVHARRVGKSNPLGMSATQIARNRLISASVAATEYLEDLAANAESESVRLGAVNSILDRTGLRGAIEINEKVEVTVNENAKVVQDRLEELRAGQLKKAAILRQVQEQANAEPIDAEVIEDE